MGQHSLHPVPFPIGENVSYSERKGLIIMNIESSTIVSLAEASQNFDRVVRIADEKGEAVIFENDRPKYKLINLEINPDMELTEDERVNVAAMRILSRYREAFKELAK